MRATNMKLALAVGVVFLLSVFSYWNDARLAERFERGQKLLPNLDPDGVAEIQIKKGDESVTLKRQDENFLVEEKHGYEAKNEAVNRFLRDLLDISLEKEVGSGESLAEELEIDPPGTETLEVALLNNSQKEMVRLRIGKELEGGSGSYVRRLDGEGSPIYLTQSQPRLDSDAGAFLNKEIVDVTSSEIKRIEGPDYVFEKEEGGSLELANLPAGQKEKATEVGQVRSALSRLSFDEVFLADDPEVASLQFAQALRVELDDGSGYVLDVAESDGKTFLQIRGFHTVTRMEVTREESDEELKEKSEVLKRVDEINRFNTRHGSWVYQLSDYTAGKLTHRLADLIEPET